ncbi:MAG TPA: inorganic phosphate transporter, partial [Clostridia bacterium]|nr:inorganic phosphate transporter [Clostridia bacterium]
MAIDFFSFLRELASNPLLAVTVLLTLGVILVNGWTDAPNAIATAVSTRALSIRAAIIMASFMNFLGVFVMTMINATVAQTIFNMVDFGPDAHASIVGLCAAMFAIVVWATAASMLGIPTSESHALIAGLSGAAIALHNSFAGINGAEWVKVLYGLLLSSVMGFMSGFLTSRLLT